MKPIQPYKKKQPDVCDVLALPLCNDSFPISIIILVCKVGYFAKKANYNKKYTHFQQFPRTIDNRNN